MHTGFVNGGLAVGETAGRAAKIDTVREVIGSCERNKTVVVSIVNQRVTKNEVTWNLSLCLCFYYTKTETQQHKRYAPFS